MVIAFRDGKKCEELVNLVFLLKSKDKNLSF